MNKPITIEDIARTICEAYCRLHKRSGWELLTDEERKNEIEHEWDLWIVEATAVYNMIKSRGGVEVDAP